MNKHKLEQKRPVQPECCCRLPWDQSNGVSFCAHPKVHAPGQLVRPAICRRCRFATLEKPANLRAYPTLVNDRREGNCQLLGQLDRIENCSTCRGDVKIKIYECDHPEHQTTDLKSCRTCIDYESRLAKGQVNQWAVGMTTAPREVPTIDRTLDSLRSAGWSNVNLFAEPDSRIPVDDHLCVTLRQSRLGAWSNWFLGLAELYQRYPDADAYLMVQDDVIFATGLRAYLENVLWPDERVGVVSVYRSSAYPARNESFSKVGTSDGLIGALALVFSPTSMRSLLTHKQALAHHRKGDRQSDRYIDTVVGRWCSLSQMPAYVHAPSLAQHIGDQSTIWESAENDGRRLADDFPGESFDCVSLCSKDRAETFVSR